MYSDHQMQQPGFYQLPCLSLDRQTSSTVKRTLRRAIEENPSLVVDLSQVEKMDSAGFGVLVECQRDASSVGGDLKLSDPVPLVRELLQLVHAHWIFEIFNNRGEAETAFLSRSVDFAI